MEVIESIGYVVDGGSWIVLGLILLFFVFNVGYFIVSVV